jgi:integrase
MSTTGSTFPTFDVQTLNDDQIQTLHAWAEGNPSFQDMVHAMKIVLDTGLRLGELRDLRWIDADLIKSQFLVKAKTPSRVVFFGPTTTQVLQERYERNPASTFIFGEGKPGTLDRVARQLACLASLIGVDSLTLRTLRHTFIARQVMFGAPVMAIKDIADRWHLTLAKAKCLMLHSDVETTRAYSAPKSADGGKQ